MWFEWGGERDTCGGGGVREGVGARALAGSFPECRTAGPSNSLGRPSDVTANAFPCRWVVQPPFITELSRHADSVT